MTDKQQALKTAYIACLGWYPVAVLSMYLTFVEIQRRFFPLLYEVSGLTEAPRLRDYLFLYKEDLLFNFAIIPSVIIATIYYMWGRRVLIKNSLLVSFLLLLLLLYANLHSWGTVGRSLTLTAAIDAMTFAWQSPRFIGMYIDADSFLKISILATGVIVFFTLSHKLAQYNYIAICAKYIVIGVLPFALISALIGYSSNMKAAPINGNFIYKSITSLAEGSWDTNPTNPTKYSDAELLKEFEKITNTQSTNRTSDLYGTSKDNDLIIFVMETGSARFIDLENDIKSFETLNMLSSNSIIALNHHATFPATSESLFSFFVSLYPPRSYYSTCVVSGEIEFAEPFPGIISSLGKAGYTSGIYLPYTDVVPLDLALHKNLGFDSVYYAQDEARRENFSRDAQALEKMKEDIAGWIKSDTRYAAAFLPQIGHAPWPDRPYDTSVAEFGKKIAVQQDQWLGQLVKVLEDNGRLDKTTIVIVGDHGIRTTKEDSSFRSGFIDKYSFHVPLLIYSKDSFPEPTYISGLTSQIDVSPTLENILGVVGNQDAAQGTYLWDSNIGDRNTFFLANWYFGSDGYRDGEEYHSYNEILDLTFTSDELNFTTADVDKDSKLANEVKTKVRKLYDIQESWVKTFLCNQNQ